MGWLKKATNSIGKATGLKSLGSGWWTDVRTPLSYAALAAAGVFTGGIALEGLAAEGSSLAALGSTLTSGGSGIAALAGAQVGVQANAAKLQKEANAQQLAAAEQQAQLAYNASLAPTEAAAATQGIDAALADDNNAARARRAYSLSKTTMAGRLGRLAGKTSLG